MDNEHKQSSRDATLTGEQIGAIRHVQNIVETILSSRAEIVGAIVSRRLQKETQASIAESEAITLSTVGALTPAVRQQVVSTICRTVISNELEQAIQHDILAARPCTLRFTDEHRKKGREAVQIHNWNAEIDAEILDLSGKILHADPHHKNRADWETISHILNKKYNVNLAVSQWRGRGGSIKMRMKKRRERKSSNEDTK